jgi:hypothetical protein
VLSPPPTLGEVLRNIPPHGNVNDCTAMRFFEAAIDWSTVHNRSIWFACLPCGGFKRQQTLENARLQAALARHLFERELDSCLNASSSDRRLHGLLSTLPSVLLDVNARDATNGLRPFDVRYSVGAQ